MGQEGYQIKACKRLVILVGVGQSKKLKSVQAEAISGAKNDENREKEQYYPGAIFLSKSCNTSANLTERRGKKK